MLRNISPTKILAVLETFLGMDLKLLSSKSPTSLLLSFLVWVLVLLLPVLALVLLLRLLL